MNILFLSHESTCRSIMAEALCRAMAPQNIKVQSAGSKPRGEIHPRTLMTLNKNRIPTEGLYSKSWENLGTRPDLIISLSIKASNGIYPAIWENPIRTEWEIPDPTQMRGREESVGLAFSDIFHLLNQHIRLLLALPLTDLSSNPAKFENMLLRVARLRQ